MCLCVWNKQNETKRNENKTDRILAVLGREAFTEKGMAYVDTFLNALRSADDGDGDGDGDYVKDNEQSLVDGCVYKQLNNMIFCSQELLPVSSRVMRHELFGSANEFADSESEDELMLSPSVKRYVDEHKQSLNDFWITSEYFEKGLQDKL